MRFSREGGGWRGGALYRVKVIWADSSGRALSSGCPHREQPGAARPLAMPTRPGADTSWKTPRKGRKKKKKGKVAMATRIHPAFWTCVQCRQKRFCEISSFLQFDWKRGSQIKKSPTVLFFKNKIWFVSQLHHDSFVCSLASASANS